MEQKDNGTRYESRYHDLVGEISVGWLQGVKERHIFLLEGNYFKVTAIGSNFCHIKRIRGSFLTKLRYLFFGYNKKKRVEYFLKKRPWWPLHQS